MTCTRPGCTRSPAAPRRDHGERVLCDACAARPGQFPPSIYDGLDPNAEPAPVARPLPRKALKNEARDPSPPTSGVPSPRPGPGPGVHLQEGRLGETPELYDLIVEHDRGRLQPVDVTLGAMPLNAGWLMREIAKDMRLLMGLRLAVEEDRPLPYAASFAARRVGLGGDKRRASRAIRALVRTGVVEEAGALPRQAGGPPDGTKLYAAPRLAVERGAVGVEVLARPSVQPPGEVEDEHVVGVAEALAGDVEGAAVAAGDGAGSGAGVVGHRVVAPQGGVPLDGTSSGGGGPTDGRWS